MASILPGSVAGERMMHLSAESKLRERLVKAVEETEEQLQLVQEQIGTLRDQRVQIDRQIITYEKRLRLRVEVQVSIAAKEVEAEGLREQLATAVNELEEYDERIGVKLKTRDSSSEAADEEYPSSEM